MHWINLPNIWSKRITPLKQRLGVKNFKPIKFDFGLAAEKCHIKLHYQDSSEQSRVLTCTVAKAIKEYLQPGRILVPKSIPPEAFQALERTTTEYVDYRNNEPYSAILEYDLVSFDTQVHAKSAMAQKRGPQLTLLDCLSSFPSRTKTVIKQAFEALSVGKASTFVIISKYNFDRPRSKDLAVTGDGSEIEQDSSSRGVIDGPDGDSGNGLLQTNPASNEVNAETIAISQELSQVKTMDHIDIMQEDNNLPAILSRNEQSPEQLTSNHKLIEEQAWQHRVQSNQHFTRKSSRTKLGTSLQDGHGAGFGTEFPGSGNSLYPTRYTRQTPVSNSQLSQEFMGFEHAKGSAFDTSMLYKSSGIFKKNSMADQPKLLHDSDERLATQLEDTSFDGIVQMNQPFGRQIMDSSLVLSLRTSTQYRRLRGTYRILAWACKYMPHLWPNVMAACMPPGCRIEMVPQSDGTSIQYVIVPPVDVAVSSKLQDLELRASQNWI